MTMEPYFDEQEEDREFLARCEARRRRRLERQKRLRRQRMIKRGVCLGVLAVLIVSVSFALRSCKKTQPEDTALEIQPMETIAPTDKQLVDELGEKLRQAAENA